ncbi:hypothetical protein [Streptomyces sp. NBC_00572]|uniref:hypothetical protein n=1 Tax=Streptomyces sp. NBC_00572 TaxID=2903664 RepID=UPI0022581235|nr:hypothetical protein [Streptomyces sp. NBC_00572]MCX4981976.1 hypothetical protein [Streptomyces sp. NBC_00572]
MITLTFSVRPPQGEAGDFDLGDVLCEGESGTAGSAGHVPDQGMMIYLSVPLLLDALRPLVAGERKAASFVGTDSSFRLDFRRGRKGVVAVSANGTAVGTCGPRRAGGGRTEARGGTGARSPLAASGRQRRRP